MHSDGTSSSLLRDKSEIKKKIIDAIINDVILHVTLSKNVLVLVIILNIEWMTIDKCLLFIGIMKNNSFLSVSIKHSNWNLFWVDIISIDDYFFSSPTFVQGWLNSMTGCWRMMTYWACLMNSPKSNITMKMTMMTLTKQQLASMKIYSRTLNLHRFSFQRKEWENI